jgi:hypothetical protein
MDVSLERLLREQKWTGSIFDTEIVLIFQSCACFSKHYKSDSGIYHNVFFHILYLSIYLSVALQPLVEPPPLFQILVFLHSR